MKLLASRVCQRVGDRASTVKALADETRAYTHSLSPRCHRHSLFAQGEKAISSSISGLLLLGCPAAILRRVALGIIDAIQRVFRGWTFAHIFEEARKRTFPMLANGNSTATIAAIGMIFRIIATLDHLRPSLILRTVAHPVRGLAELVDFSSKTTTAFRVSTAQILGNNSRNSSAGAETKPAPLSEFMAYRRQRYQPAKSLAREVSHAAIIYKR